MGELDIKIEQEIVICKIGVNFIKVEFIVKLVCVFWKRVEKEYLKYCGLCFVLIIVKVCYDYDVFLDGKDFYFLDICIDILILCFNLFIEEFMQ